METDDPDAEVALDWNGSVRSGSAAAMAVVHLRDPAGLIFCVVPVQSDDFEEHATTLGLSLRAPSGGAELDLPGSANRERVLRRLALGPERPWSSPSSSTTSEPSEDCTRTGRHALERPRLP